MKSKDTEKERLLMDIQRKLEPYREALADADMQCDLARKIERLEYDLRAKTAVIMLQEAEIAKLKRKLAEAGK